jgi:hypothetical protein
MKLRAFADPNLLENSSILRAYYASPAAPVGDFCTGSLLEKTSTLRTYCASSAAPVGDFCMESLLEKTSILRTYCAILAAPVSDFCMESFGEGFDFAHLLCYSGCTRRRLLHGESGYALRRLLHGVSHATVVSAAPRGDFGVLECRRPSMRSFSTLA